MEWVRTSLQLDTVAATAQGAVAASPLLSRCTASCIPSGLLHKTSQRSIAFRSQGATLRGYLIMPHGVAETNGVLPPVILLSHGFSTTQHMGLLHTARAICERSGCAAVTFDHAGFGESDGPRLMFSYWQQTCGYLDCITYLVQHQSAVVDVERIAVWGESASSRDAVVAGAVEPRVKAILAVTPPCGRNPVGNLTLSAPQELDAEAAKARGVEQELHRQIFDRMREQLVRMRTRVSSPDDLSHGETGGAWIPTVATSKALLVVPDVKLKGGATGATRDAFFTDFTASEPGPTALDTLNVATPTPGANSLGRGRRPSVWIKEEERCKYPETIYAFLNAYSQLPNAKWCNEIFRVEYKEFPAWEMIAAMPQASAALLFLVSENDEMQNCGKQAQYDAFSLAKAARAPSRIVEVPCHSAPGGYGHAGMMDACGLIGHRATWLGMVDECAKFLREAL